MSEFDIEKEAKILWGNNPMPEDIIAFGRRCADNALEKAAEGSKEHLDVERERVSNEKGHLRSMALGAMECAETIEAEIRALKSDGWNK